MTYNQNVKKMIEEYLHFYLIKMIFAFFLIGIFAFLNGHETYLNINLKKKKLYNKKEEGKKK